MKTLLSITSAALLVAAIGIAQDKQAPPRQSPEQVFAALDTNKDQKLSETEIGPLFANAKADDRKQMFTQWDSDHDGSISMQEFAAGYRSAGGGGEKQ
jgi:Ca2+-binding EF-hand superfamily protein